MGYLDVIERLEGPTKDTARTQRSWLDAWRELARLTYGIEPGDGRLARVLDALNQCDEAFIKDDWQGFERGSLRVSVIVQGKQGR